jgi:hypothetical protein
MAPICGYRGLPGRPLFCQSIGKVLLHLGMQVFYLSLFNLHLRQLSSCAFEFGSTGRLFPSPCASLTILLENDVIS